MRHPLRLSFVAALALCVGTFGAQAQITAPPVPSILPPPPPPSAPPPPSMAVPVVPRLDSPAPPPPSRSRPDARRSFNDRIIGWLDSAEAAALAPGDRVAFSRYCANRVE